VKQRLAQISLLVRDYDEAIQYYTDTLNFVLVEDTKLSETKRWVRIAPQGDSSFTLLLAKADGEHQQSFIGNQTGGRVFLFLYTDDFWRDYNSMMEKGVRFTRQPATEPYGTVAVFEDMYGNLWDFIEPSQKA
jgi:catechol 2,3-dioxygenase-like lactoylglutathione lyase family enzyme